MARVIRARIAASAAPSETAGRTRFAQVPRAERNCECDGDNHCRPGELDRRGHALENGGRNRLVRAKRASEIPAQRTPEKTAVLFDQRAVQTESRAVLRDGAGQERQVLLEQRAIEPEPLPQFVDIGLRCRLAEHRLRRIAGNEMNEREHQGRDAEQYRDRQRDAPREKPKQTSALCLVLVRAEHILRDRHFVQRETGFVEGRLGIGIAKRIRAVLDGTFLQILVDLVVRALVHNPALYADAMPRALGSLRWAVGRKSPRTALCRLPTTRNVARLCLGRRRGVEA